MANDLIRLTVPASGEYAKTVRMTAAALASRMDMSYDDVDDVRIAAEEAFIYAVDAAAENAEVTFEFSVGDDSIEMCVPIAGSLDLSDEEIERRATYATFILEAVCDEFGLASDESGVASLRLLKRAGSVDAD